MKPMLADDYVEAKLRFPLIVQPKIDGVRAINFTGSLVGRSLKAHANVNVTAMFSQRKFVGLDGEMAAGKPVSPTLCRDTTSLLNSRDKAVGVLDWWVFDLLPAGTPGARYMDRLDQLEARVRILDKRVKMIPSYWAHTLAELEELDAQMVSAGYEGTILRDPYGLYKEGRSTPKECGLLRIKHFVEEDAVVLAVEEGRSNKNAAKVNELGHTERSTHKENMVPNGQVGVLKCRDVKTGKPIDVAPGCLTAAQRREYLLHPERIVGHTIKYKHFLHGAKDLPRFPTYQSHRARSDQS